MSAPLKQKFGYRPWLVKPPSRNAKVCHVKTQQLPKCLHFLFVVLVCENSSMTMLQSMCFHSASIVIKIDENAQRIQSKQVVIE